jgi:UTP--glucose-1-phosphate uridylyltransferase
LTDILVVTGRGKRAIEDHFDRNFELEYYLEQQSKHDLLKEVQQTSEMADIHYIRQRDPLGLGHAVSVAREHVGDEPFALLMGDTIVEPANSAAPVTRQLCDVWEKHGGSAIAVEEVPEEKVSRYGIVGGDEIAPGLIRATSLVEKPKPADAPSRLAITSRYVLSPTIFSALEKTTPGKNGELQLTDALARLVQSEPVFGWRYGGRRFDIGDKLGFVKTNIEFALRDPAIAADLHNYLRNLAG